MTDKHKPGPLSNFQAQRRVERTNDLWVEIRDGYGLSDRMVADCVEPGIATMIAAAPDLLYIVQKLHSFAIAGNPFCYPQGTLQEIEFVLSKIYQSNTTEDHE